MRNRSDIFDHSNVHSGSGDTADCGFATGAGSFDADFDFFHSQQLSLLGSITGDDLSGINGEKRPGIVHRIDKDTSGVLMIAKNDMAHQSLAAQLAEHSITRKYNAVVYNGFNEDEGTVNQPIGRNPQDRKKMAVTQKHSRHAVTHYRVIERMEKFTLIEAQLETGRTHQIRVHMTYIGHPLLGDPVYGPKKQPISLEGQALHARVLGFIHPRTGEYMEFEAPLPPYFEALLERLRK